MLPTALHRASVAAKTAADNKGQDVLVLDLRGLTPVFDFFVISTGASRRQVHAIVEDTDAALRATGDARMGVEGYDASKWVVQDYGDVVIHVFDADTRDYYKLEELWADAKKIDWQAELDDARDDAEDDAADAVDAANAADAVDATDATDAAE
ncbi:Iojap protein [Fimbriiglobus ruber]|uniref:Ribosomal silencing factor RsfS n=1 Tax=Fimbriiglobus ruber TaxID=1908690 RepID=A0A225DHH7_9BACT|nr:Iojap protein [Fimbriiglobus ruber]